MIYNYLDNNKIYRVLINKYNYYKDKYSNSSSIKHELIIQLRLFNELVLV